MVWKENIRVQFSFYVYVGIEFQTSTFVYVLNFQSVLEVNFPMV